DGPLLRLQVEGAQGPASQNVECDVAANAFAVEQPDQIIDAADRFTIHTHDGVQAHQAGLCRRPMWLKTGDHGARAVADPGIMRMPARNRLGLRGDADVAPADTAVLDQLAKHELCGIAGDRKADSLRALDDSGVDADHLAARGYQRTTRIAWVQCCIGLY